jgi:hypothetical protein
MPAPPGRKDVTAADIGAAAPIKTIELVDDFGKPIAKDIRDVAAMSLKNMGYVLADHLTEYSYSDVPVPSLAPLITAPNLAAGNAWVNTSIFIDIPNCKIGDDLKMAAWGSWMLNAVSNATTVGRLRISIYVDPAGVNTPLATSTTGYATIGDDSGNLAVPHTENYSVGYRYRVTGPIPTDPVTLRVIVQARSEDLAGGAGTATLLFLHTAKLDVTHVKRS